MCGEQVDGSAELDRAEVEGGVWDDIAARGALALGVAFNVGEGPGGVEESETGDAGSATAGLLWRIGAAGELHAVACEAEVEALLV